MKKNVIALLTLSSMLASYALSPKLCVSTIAHAETIDLIAGNNYDLANTEDNTIKNRLINPDSQESANKVNKEAMEENDSFNLGKEEAEKQGTNDEVKISEDLETSSIESSNQENSKSETKPSDKSDVVKGNWGTASYAFNETSGILTIQSGSLGDSSSSPWNQGIVSSESIKIIELIGDVSAPKDSGFLFSSYNGLHYLNNLKEVRGNLDVSQVTSITNMFRGCNSLTKLDVSRWDTNNVTDMGSVFRDCINLTSIDVSRWKVDRVTNMGRMFQNCKNLTNIDVSEWDVSLVNSMGSMFEECENVIDLDVSNWDISRVENIGSMFKNCQNLLSLNVSNWDTGQVVYMDDTFNNCVNLRELIMGAKSILDNMTNLPDNSWIGMSTHNRYSTSTDFLNNYDGSEPETYVWNGTANLEIEVEQQEAMKIGIMDQLNWSVNHTTQSTQGRTAKNIIGTIYTTETIDFSTELIVEKYDANGTQMSTSKISLISEGIVNDRYTYSYVLPDLEYGFQYKMTLEGMPWNNTTLSSNPTFEFEVSYDANLKGPNGDTVFPESASKTDSRVIENGTLSFKDVPTELRFNSTKLGVGLNDQLISRENMDWQVAITDFRGTKEASVTDNSASRQDWDLVATAEPFVDSSNQEVGLDTLGVVYVDDTNTLHELSTTETLLNHHEIDGEIPKVDNLHNIKWAKDRGLQAVVHNRNKLKTDEMYRAEITFELRNAP